MSAQARSAGVPPASDALQAGRLRYSDWTEWQPLDGVAPLSPAVLAEILDGGQAFRWRREAEVGSAAPSPRSSAVTWLGVWADCVARVRLDAKGNLQWSAPIEISSRVATALPTYFAAEKNFPALADALPWRSDTHLAGCIENFRGLRILRQPFGETLLGFLCSATKQIVQIKQMLALVAARHGREICRASVLLTPSSEVGQSGVSKTDALPQPIYRLPTWPELAAIPEAQLRACQLGFRAKFIHQTARFLAAHDGWLEETEALPYADAKARLCSLPGVGEKVADCVLLFGAGKLEAFPVDTWILKTLARRYGLDGWRHAPLAQFGRAHFGPLAGFAQQFLFAWERRHGRARDAA